MDLALFDFDGTITIKGTYPGGDGGFENLLAIAKCNEARQSLSSGSGRRYR